MLVMPLNYGKGGWWIRSYYFALLYQKPLSTRHSFKSYLHKLVVYLTPQLHIIS